MIKTMTMANCFRKIIFRFSITKGKWPLPVQENPDHMGKNGCQKRILHPKKHRKQSFLSIAHFNIFFLQTSVIKVTPPHYQSYPPYQSNPILRYIFRTPCLEQIDFFMQNCYLGCKTKSSQQIYRFIIFQLTQTYRQTETYTHKDTEVHTYTQ